MLMSGVYSGVLLFGGKEGEGKEQLPEIAVHSGHEQLRPDVFIILHVKLLNFDSPKTKC